MTGERALQIAAGPDRPDLILRDIMMPQMDGHEVLRWLRADPATAEIPVIFVTAMAQETDEETGLRLGAVDYIIKPISPPIVLQRVRKQLELKAARDVLKDTNAWLERELAWRMRENLLIQDLTIEALASLAEAHDTGTGLHWTCTGSVLVRCSCQAAFCSKATGDLQPKAEYWRRGLQKLLMYFVARQWFAHKP